MYENTRVVLLKTKTNSHGSEKCNEISLKKLVITCKPHLLFHNWIFFIGLDVQSN